ncbi:Aldehyde dehydrogenase [Blyttiomyces sp. JEL0837]|nr:Aldehyde dehydrogenase [Blyttiomyces sp. JEL0837]
MSSPEFNLPSLRTIAPVPRQLRNNTILTWSESIEPDYEVAHPNSRADDFGFDVIPVVVNGVEVVKLKRVVIEVAKWGTILQRLSKKITTKPYRISELVVAAAAFGLTTSGFYLYRAFTTCCYLLGPLIFQPRRIVPFDGVLVIHRGIFIDNTRCFACRLEYVDDLDAPLVFIDGRVYCSQECHDHHKEVRHEYTAKTYQEVKAGLRCAYCNWFFRPGDHEAMAIRGVYCFCSIQHATAEKAYKESVTTERRHAAAAARRNGPPPTIPVAMALLGNDDDRKYFKSLITRENRELLKTQKVGYMDSEYDSQGGEVKLADIREILMYCPTTNAKVHVIRHHPNYNYQRAVKEIIAFINHVDLLDAYQPSKCDYYRIEVFVGKDNFKKHGFDKKFQDFFRRLSLIMTSDPNSTAKRVYLPNRCLATVDRYMFKAGDIEMPSDQRPAGLLPKDHFEDEDLDDFCTTKCRIDVIDLINYAIVMRAVLQPGLMMAWKLGPALATGNVIVMKTSEKTPLSALKICELIVETGFPPGVVNVISGFGPTAGDAIVRHMDIRKVAFTGSTGTGRLIMAAAAASNLKKVSLELGGKSPNIVLADANLEMAVKASIIGFTLNQGQCCCGGSRVYVQEPVYEQFINLLRQHTSNIAIGHAFDGDKQMGPLVDEIQFNRVMGYIVDGKKEGAQVETGGVRVGDKGYFVAPTIFSGVNDDMKIAREEIFGPVVVYGLAAAVHTTNVSMTHKMARELHSGTVWINTYNLLAAHIPFGGFKESGIGRENGEYALHEYTQIKSVVVQL